MIPRRSLLTIFALVLALHALVLGVALPDWGASQAAPIPRFMTRTIAAPAPVAAPAAVETTAQTTKTAVRKKPRPGIPRPASADAKETSLPPPPSTALESPEVVAAADLETPGMPHEEAVATPAAAAASAPADAPPTPTALLDSQPSL